MSWGEVKKINSDLNVPLDEREKYIAGVIPRNLEKKTYSISKVHEFYDSSEIPKVTEAVVVDISGKGLVMLAKAVSEHLSSEYGINHSELELNIDGRTLTIKSPTVSSGNSPADSYVSLDISSYTGLPYSKKVVTSRATINSPIEFKNNLKVTYRLVNSEWRAIPGEGNVGRGSATVDVIILE